MFVGPIENDAYLSLEIGDRLMITTDEKVIGKNMTIHVKNCTSFSPKLLEYA